jgi:membrane protease YdiL (CAAX protease family)
VYLLYFAIPVTVLPSIVGKEEDRMDRKTLLLVGSAIFLALTVLAWGGLYLSGEPLGETLARGEPIGRQLVWGTTIGVLLSGIGLVLVYRFQFLRTYRDIVEALYWDIRPRWLDLLYIGLGAGWSEELFFRGLLQPHIGLFWSSVLFWLAHGAFSLKHPGINLYGLAVFAAGILLGWIFETQGLVAAMSSHAALDLTTLFGFQLSHRAQVRAAKGDRI